MIGVARGVSVLVYAEPVDMRKHFDTLAKLVDEQLKQTVTSGDVFVFVSRDRKRTKVLYFDGTGMCLFCKRLERGQFMAPWKRAKGDRMEMTLSELALFVEGSEAVGRMPLSPPLLTRLDLRTKRREIENQNL